MALMINSIVFVILFLFPFITYNVGAQDPVVYDITKYGAKPGADISEALLKAWNEASNSTSRSKIVIPEGTWSLTQVRLAANKAPLELEVKGTVKADPDINKLPNKEGEWITINYVNNFTLSGGGVFDGQGQEAWKKNDCHKNSNCVKLPINLSFNFIKNTVIRDVTTKDSKNWHVNCISSENVTFQRFTISAPGNSPNSDGIHIARATNIQVLDSMIGTGDDCISIGDEMNELHIVNVTCGPGHGISVGSLGRSTTEKDVIGIYVKNCTFIETSNGVRVKTWPSAPATSHVTGLYFEDLIMKNVSSPVIIDQEYCPYNLCKLDKPSLIKVSKVKINNIRGTSWTKEAMTFRCSGAKPCENVEIGNIDLTYSGTDAGAQLTTNCSNILNPTFVGKQNPPVCAPLPQSS